MKLLERIRFKAVLSMLIFMMLYVLLGLLSWNISQINDAVSENLFLPEGLALACSFLLGLRPACLVILVGQFSLGTFHHLPYFLNILTTLANLIVMTLGNLSLRASGFLPSLARSRDYLALIMVEALVLQPAIRLLGRLILWVLEPGSAPQWQDIIDLHHFWLIEQATCEVAISSFLLALNDFRRHCSIQRSLELSGLLSLAIWLGLLLFHGHADWLGLLHIISAAYLGTLLMASRTGMLGAMSGSIILLSFTQYAMHHGHSPLEQLGDVDAQLEFINLLVLGVMLSSGLLATLLREREDQAHQLSILVQQDPLTSLYNRRHFYVTGDQLLSRMRRNPNTRAALLALDIDHFKSINDRFGHNIGDQVLILFSEVLRSSLRQSDILARLGGEEFAILTEDNEQPTRIAERLRQALARELALQSILPPVTFSTGITRLLATDTLDSAYKRADDALYAAKNSGRDCIVSHEDGVWHAEPVAEPGQHAYKSEWSKDPHALAVSAQHEGQPHG